MLEGWNNGIMEEWNDVNNAIAGLSPDIERGNEIPLE